MRRLGVLLMGSLVASAGCVDTIIEASCSGRPIIQVGVPDYNTLGGSPPLVVWVGDTSYVGASAYAEISEFCADQAFTSTNYPFDYSWTVADPAIVEMLAPGSAIGLAPGSTKVTATFRGKTSSPATIRVGSAIDHGSITVTGNRVKGDTLTATVALFDASGQPVSNGIISRDLVRRPDGGYHTWFDTSKTALVNRFVPTSSGVHTITVQLPRLGHPTIVLSTTVTVK